jgi:hypothetical protein
MRHLPHPLGCSVPINAEWYNVCPREDIHFKELHELAQMTSPTACTWEMNIAHVSLYELLITPNQTVLGLVLEMARDIVDVLQGWRHNTEGVPLLIRGESGRTLNIPDIDVGMWLKKLSPKSWPISASVRPPLISIFSEPGRWKHH